MCYLVCVYIPDCSILLLGHWHEPRPPSRSLHLLHHQHLCQPETQHRNQHHSGIIVTPLQWNILVSCLSVIILSLCGCFSSLQLFWVSVVVLILCSCFESLWLFWVSVVVLILCSCIESVAVLNLCGYFESLWFCVSLAVLSLSVVVLCFVCETCC